MVPLLALTNFVFTDVQFTTHLSDALDKPVFKKGAAFVYKYQAMTPKSESKIRVFSPFPKVTEINSTDAYTVSQTRGHTALMTGMDTVKLCRTERMRTFYDQLFDQLEEKLSLIQKEINAAHTDHKEPIEVASYFLPPSTTPDHGSALRNALWEYSQPTQVPPDWFLEVQSKTLHVQRSPSLIFEQTTRTWKKILTTSWRLRIHFRLCWKSTDKKRWEFFYSLKWN